MVEQVLRFPGSLRDLERLHDALQGNCCGMNPKLEACPLCPKRLALDLRFIYWGLWARWNWLHEVNYVRQKG